jgi:hypothetical protein
VLTPRAIDRISAHSRAEIQTAQRQDAGVVLWRRKTGERRGLNVSAPLAEWRRGDAATLLPASCDHLAGVTPGTLAEAALFAGYDGHGKVTVRNGRVGFVVGVYRNEVADHRREFGSAIVGELSDPRRGQRTD